MVGSPAPEKSRRPRRTTANRAQTRRRADRENRIHRARYAAIAREIAVLVPRDISRFDTPRRLATLVVFAREMEVILTDAALAMFDKMLGAIFRRADHAHQDNVVDRAKTLDASTRALLGMAKAMLAAKAKNEDQVAAVERALGWERLKTLVSETEAAVAEYATGQSRRGRRALYERAAHVARHPRCFLFPIVERQRSAARGARRGAGPSRERREETPASSADVILETGMAQARQDRTPGPIAEPMRSRS